MISTVIVDAVDLERLVRLAHQINRDTVATFHRTGTPWECTCGHFLTFECDDDTREAESAARAYHGTHLAYHLRQALAGRIEFV